MLTVPSSFTDKYTPYVEGGAHSLSTSSLSAVICSRASWRASVRRSLRPTACAAFAFALVSSS